MRKALLPVLAVLMLIVSQACAVGAEITPQITIRKLPPLESGVISVTDAVWNQLVSIPHFANFKNKPMPIQQTEVRMAYDDVNVYIAFRCFELNMEQISANCTEDGGPVWRDDSVEVLLDPKRDGKTYFHMVANAAGAKFGKQGAFVDSSKWNGPWTVDVHRGVDAWTVLVTVSFQSLGVATPKPGSTWNANFGRHQISHAELSSWSPVQGGFAEPASFGQIVFGGTDIPIISTSGVDIGAPGKYPLTVRVNNPSNGTVKLQADMLLNGQNAGRFEQSAAPGNSEWKLNFNFPYEGRYKLNFTVANASTNQVFVRTASVPLDIPDHRARLGRYREVVRGLVSVPSAHEPELNTIRKTLGELVAFEPTAEGNAEKWSEFGAKLDAVEPQISRLRYACADKDKKGYAIGTESSLRKILLNRFFEGKLGESAHISVARNEYEAVQAVIIPYSKALRNVTVSISVLKGPGDTAIPIDRVTLNRVDYVRTREPRYDVEHVGWWPDPLMPMKTFMVPKGGIQPIWITVHPTEDTPAGVYQGDLIVQPANAPETRLPIRVRVWDFTLPKETHLKTAFALFESEIAAWYGGMNEDTKRAYYQFMLDHRLNPMNLYSKAPVPTMEDLSFCAERGLNAFSLAYTHNKSEEDRKQFADMIRKYEAYLKEKGWWDKAYIYGFDEIPREKYPDLRDMYGWLKQEFPDLPRMCTVVPNEDLKGCVDIWVPLTANWNQKDATAYTKQGDQVWWYVCCNPHHPYPNFFIDYPAVDPRIIFWMAWKYQVPGFLYYAVNNWMTNRAVDSLPPEHQAFEEEEFKNAIRAGRRWPEVEWNTFTFDDYNGDGHLIYPGPDGKPISSIRMECIRDGIEDYEMYYLLKDLVKKADRNTDKALLAKARRLLNIEDAIVKSPSDYTLDPGTILTAREEIAVTIEGLSRGQ